MKKKFKSVMKNNHNKIKINILINIISDYTVMLSS